MPSRYIPYYFYITWVKTLQIAALWVSKDTLDISKVLISDWINGGLVLSSIAAGKAEGSITR